MGHGYRLTYSDKHNFIIKYIPFAHPTYVDWGSMLIRSLDALVNQGAAADLGIDGGGAPSQCHWPHVILGLFPNSSQPLHLIL